MRPSLAKLGCVVALAWGCHDFDTDYAQCQQQGRCGPSPDASAADASADASVDAGSNPPSVTGFCGGADGGWCWENPLPHGLEIDAVFVTDAGAVWTVGEDGLLARLDAQGWTALAPAGLAGSLVAIWGAQPDDLWTCGDGGLFRWNGSSWVVPSIPVGAAGPYTSIWGSGSTDVWIVGPSSSLHYDGLALKVDPFRASAIFGTAASSIWAIAPEADGGSALSFFDGGSWSAPAPLPWQGSDLWADPGSEVWVAGRGGVLLAPNANELAAGTCQSLWGTDPNDLWATCQPPLGNVQHRVAAAEWTADTPVVDSARTLSVLGGLDPEQPWVAGTEGLIYGRQLDAGWTRQSQGSVRGVDFMYGLDAGDHLELFATSQAGLLHRVGEHWDVIDAGATSYGRGVWGDSPSNVWTLNDTSLLHFDGSGWTSYPTPTLSAGHTLRCLWGTGEELWSGDDGYANLALWHWKADAGWTAIPAFTDGGAPEQGHVYGIQGLAPNDIWVAASYFLLHWDGMSLTTSAPGSWHVAVQENAPNDVWVLDSPGLIHLRHWNGQSWSEVGAPALPIAANALWSSGPTDVWMAGDNGLLAHWDGTRMSGPIQSVTPESLNAVWTAGAGSPVFAAGLGGSIVRMDR